MNENLNRFIFNHAIYFPTSTRITTLKELRDLSNQHKSVYCPNTYAWRRPRPAAFMINLSGAILINLFESGMYEYVKPLSFLNM